MQTLGWPWEVGDSCRKSPIRVPLIVSLVLVLENTWKLRRVSRSSPLHFALHYPLSLIRLATGPPQLRSPPGPQVPLLGSWQPQTPGAWGREGLGCTGRQACVWARLGHLQKPPEPGPGALSPKLAEG